MAHDPNTDHLIAKPCAKHACVLPASVAKDAPHDEVVVVIPAKPPGLVVPEERAKDGGESRALHPVILTGVGAAVDPHQAEATTGGSSRGRIRSASTAAPTTRKAPINEYRSGSVPQSSQSMMLANTTPV